MMKKLCVVLGFVFSLICYSGNAQQLGGQDLSKVRIESISDADLRAYYDRAKSANLTDQQIIDNLLQRGLPQSEVNVLQQRLARFSSAPGGTENSTASPANNTPRKMNGTEAQPVKTRLDSFEARIYGMDIFSTPEAFNSNLRLATPPDYIVGPDDELNITIYGYSDKNEKVIVNPDGYITIQNVGPIYVNGLTIEDARKKITKKLASTIYPAINSGKTNVQVTLGNIRTIRVTVIGQARKPGVYTVSSLTTLFNVLYLCGGPNVNGSFRNIELIRAGKKLLSLDIYEYLQTGDILKNSSLKDNDVIRIPYFDTRVQLTGQVKRPGIFEPKQSENFPDILTYAGGFTDSAYTAQVRVLQMGEKERKVTVITKAEFPSYHPQKGDEIIVEKIIDRYANRVTLTGAVYRPGFYDLTPDMSLKQLLERADGLKEDAYVDRAWISRLDLDQTRRLIAFNALDVLTGKSDIKLQREDEVSVPSVLDLRDSIRINVNGQVRIPGVYPYRRGMTVKDAILAAGGFSDAATAKRLEIGRRITNSPDSSKNMQIAEVLNVDTERDLGTSGNSVELKPYDMVIVRNNPGYYMQRYVTVAGEVRYPGLYVLSEKNERVSDIIARAGGVTDLADPRAASLKRGKLDEGRDTLRGSISSLNLDAKDSLANTRTSNQIGMNLDEILKKPHTAIDVMLEGDDIVNIPKRDAIIKVRGEILQPTQLSYIPGENISFYVNRAGGFTERAQRKNTYVIGANGNGRRTRHFLFFKKYPSIEPGDEIWVPKATPKRPLTAGEVIGITTGIAGLATIVLSIINFTKK